MIPVTPVQEMALFGAVGELFSGLHVLFVLPKCLLWLGAMDELADDRAAVRRRTLAAGVARPRSPRWLTRLQRVRYRLLVPTAAAVVAMVWLISQVRYDSTYLHMIERDRAAARRLRAVRRGAACPARSSASSSGAATTRRSVDAALNAALVDATAEIEALPEVSKVVGPAAIFAEVAPALAGDEPLTRFAADDAVGDRRLHLRAVGRQHRDRQLRARRPRRLSPGRVLSRISTTPGSSS